jgi:hypothetical protein
MKTCTTAVRLVGWLSACAAEDSNPDFTVPSTANEHQLVSLPENFYSMLMDARYEPSGIQRHRFSRIEDQPFND